MVSMSLKGFLSELSLKKAPGPLPSFSALDLIRLLKLLAEAGSIGRGKISKIIGLGEGVIRTMLARLAEAGLITISKKGCSLTQKGEALWRSIKEVLPKTVEVKGAGLGLAPKSVAILVRGRAERVKSGIEQRDAAVSSGAKGAITLVCKDNKVIIPGVNADLKRDYPAAFEEIMRLMEPEDGDVIIISSADTLKEAEYGALAAAWSII
ncbi:MAG: DUF4443 domain-containing protein [Candidatus Bathyarchaeia archaeon]